MLSLHGVPSHVASEPGLVTLWWATHRHLLSRTFSTFEDIRSLEPCTEIKEWLTITNVDFTLYENGVRLCIVFDEPMEAKLFKLAFDL